MRSHAMSSNHWNYFFPKIGPERRKFEEKLLFKIKKKRSSKKQLAFFQPLERMDSIFPTIGILEYGVTFYTEDFKGLGGLEGFPRRENAV